MRPVTVTLAAAGVSAPVVIDQYLAPINLGISVVVTNTNTTKVQYSLDDPFAAYATDYNTNATWFDAAAPLASITATTYGSITTPVRAVRLNCTSFTSGSAAMTVVQAGMPGAS
jgi:hypothetical protein